VLLWDLAAGKERFPAGPGHRAAPTALAFTADGRTLVSAGAYGEQAVRLWDMGEGKERLVIPEAVPWGFTLAPDRQTVVTRAPDHLTVWDAATGKEVGRLPVARAFIPQAVVSPDGKTLALFGTAEPNVRLYDLPALKPRCTLQGTPLPTALVLAFSGDGQTVATADARGLVRLWDARTGQGRPVKLTAPVKPGRYPLLALSRDGKAVAALSDGQVKLWNAQNGEEWLSFTFPASARLTYALQFSPTGDRLLASNLHGVKLWDVATRTEIPAPKPAGESFAALLWSPDGKLLLASDLDGRLTVWDAVQGKEHRTLSLPGAAAAFAFAPDSRHLATANTNGTIYLLRLFPAAGVP
jgi:WD40 repeat protein